MASCRSSTVPWLHVFYALLLLNILFAQAKKAYKGFKMIEPVSIGHTRSVSLPHRKHGGSVQMETLSLDPPLFHMKGLLTDKEADSILKSVRKRSWQSSAMDTNRVDTYRESMKNRQDWLDMFMFFDKDGDSALSEEEIANLARVVFDIGRHNHTEFLHHHKLPADQGNIAERVVFKRRGFVKYFLRSREKHPERAMRYGSTVWLPYAEDLVARRVKDYARAVSDWPQDLFENPSENLQVAHYSVGGHFSCHPDATRQAKRMATMILFLNTPPGGGELVFPGADQPDFETTLSEESFDLNCSNWGGCLSMGGVVVKPSKGDAVFWYNMKTNLLKRPGRYKRKELIIDRALHCGADVSAGEKYIATVWVNLPRGYGYADEDT